jgi:hypothetical protein
MTAVDKLRLVLGALLAARRKGGALRNFTRWAASKCIAESWRAQALRLQVEYSEADQPAG